VEPSPYDLVLITLADPVKFTDKRMPICLPTADTVDLGVVVYSAGWGNLRTTDTCLTDQAREQWTTNCLSNRCII
jgi:hypothetical protein